MPGSSTSLLDTPYSAGNAAKATGVGPKKVTERTIAKGRAIIMTDEDLANYDWNDIPEGAALINTSNGVIQFKLRDVIICSDGARFENAYIGNGDLILDAATNEPKLKPDGVTPYTKLDVLYDSQTNWIPANIKDDRTLSIAKDSMIVEETFTVVNPVPDSNGNFEYTNSLGEHRYMPITSEGYFIFQLEHGTYQKLRNHLEVVIDDALRRSAVSGGIVELTDSRFAITEPLVTGQEITARYIRVFRIGNPYPRVFMSDTEPEAAEVGDFWLAYAEDLDSSSTPYSDTDLPGDAYSGVMKLINVVHAIMPNVELTEAQQQNLKNQVKSFFSQLEAQYPGVTIRSDVINAIADYCGGKIPWSIISHPTTMAGYGIQDSYSGSWRAHSHQASDITDLATELNKKVAGLTSVTNVSGHYANNMPGGLMYLDSNGAVPSTIWKKSVSSNPHGFLQPGSIIQWCGNVANVPSGWALCDGSSHPTASGTFKTPDLSAEFIPGSAGVPTVYKICKLPE